MDEHAANAPVASSSDILRFWLGTPPQTRADVGVAMARWYGANADWDTEIASRFETTLATAAGGGLDAWAAEPKSRLALIILLDQLPRNIYRGRAEAFATDAKALELTKSGIAANMDHALEPLERLFFYMPLEHSESLQDQDLSVTVFESLAKLDVAPHFRDAVDQAAEYAHKHRDIIARFGRFPHRNTALGRSSSAEEIQYLQSGGPSFGQHESTGR